MLIVYKFNDITGECKATGVFYNEDKNEYHNYHKIYNEKCAWLPGFNLEYDDYGNCISLLDFSEIVLAKKHNIANMRYQEQISNLYIEEFNSTFYGSKESQADITREISTIEDAIQMGYWDPQSLISWKTLEGFVDLSLTDLKKVRLYFSQRTQMLFNKENNYVNQINNSTTVLELNTIEWSEE